MQKAGLIGTGLAGMYGVASLGWDITAALGDPFYYGGDEYSKEDLLNWIRRKKKKPNKRC